LEGVGNLAIRMARTLECEIDRMRVTGVSEANRVIRPECRDSWCL
jgi:hypothetical protein